MEFCVPTNWQEGIIEHLRSVNTAGEIREVYGKIFSDTIGYEAAFCGLGPICRKKAQRHIESLFRHGLNFNYLLDDICLDNLEFTRKGQRKIRGILEWLTKVGVMSVTVANPYLMMWIKKNYPFLSIHVSASANVDSLSRAKFWEGIGADKITFPGPAVNRNFRLIGLLRKSLNCKIQLLGNSACRYGCASYINHALNAAHLSRKPHKYAYDVSDYYAIICWVRRLENPVDFIRSDWIRPEDVCFYEKMGVDGIQLVDIEAAQDTFLRVCGDYIRRCHKGNLLELFPGIIEKIFIRHNRKLKGSSDAFLTPDQPKAGVEVFIDNQGLSDFLKEMPSECDLDLCGNCGYCLGVAKRVVRIDDDYLKKALVSYKKTIDDLLQ